MGQEKNVVINAKRILRAYFATGCKNIKTTLYTGKRNPTKPKTHFKMATQFSMDQQRNDMTIEKNFWRDYFIVGNVRRYDHWEKLFKGLFYSWECKT